MRKLELNFFDASKIDACLQALKEVSPVEFTAEKSVPSTRQFLTQPEYLDVKGQLILTFNNQDVFRFMSDPRCKEVYQSFAN